MMRLLKVLLALTLLSMMALPAWAQDTALEFGAPVTGEISDREFEFEYSFTGSEGQIISLEMSPGENSELDPEVYLYSTDNELLAANDDFSYPTARIYYMLPADGEYLIVATRNEGRSGTTTGEFVLDVSVIEAVAPGSTVEAVYSTDFFTATPTVYLLAPIEDQTVTLTYSQDLEEVYGSIRVQGVPDWSIDPEYGFYEDFLYISNTAISTQGSVTLNLTGGRLYLVRVEFGGYSPGSGFAAEEGKMSITVE
jgi:hypothetical protein